MSDPYLICAYCNDPCACRKLRDEYEALKEVALHASMFARGDEDGAKLAELLDKLEDPELRFTR